MRVCVRCVCVCTVEGTDSVLFGPAGRLVFEGVTQRIAAVTKTCRPLDLDRQPARHCVFPVIHSLSHFLNLSPSLFLSHTHTHAHTHTHTYTRIPILPRPIQLLPKNLHLSDVSVLQRCVCVCVPMCECTITPDCAAVIPPDV